MLLADSANNPEDVREFAQFRTRGALAFFVGAGISCDAGVPVNFAREAAPLFLPTDEPNLEPLVEKVTDSIQQERFFEIVRRVHAARVRTKAAWDELLNIWQGADPQRQERAGVLCSPLGAHFGITSYSFDHDLPIFTANVDCLFEAAASAQGIPYRVVTPTACSASGDAQGRVLEIVKFHGSVRLDAKLRLDTLCCEMGKITRPDPVLLARMMSIAESHTLCFWGYSGRDLDYFQKIRSRLISGPSSCPFWIDLAYDEGWEGPVRFNARSVRARCLGPSQTGWPREQSGKKDLNPLFDQLRTESKASMAVERSQRLLTLALCLEGIGLYEDALAVFNQYLPSVRDEPGLASIEADLVHARLLDGTSKYVESQMAARRALSALERRLPSSEDSEDLVAECQALRAIQLESMARKLRFIQPPVLKAAGSLGLRLLPRAVFELVRSFAWDTLRLRLYFARLRRIEGASDEPLVQVQYLLAMRALNDHGIANVAVMIGMAKFKPLRRWLVKSIVKLQEGSQQTGDAFGFVSAQKYLARANPDDSLASLLAISLHEQTTDPLNHSASLMALAGTKPAEEKGPLIEAALRAAGCSGSHAATLKIMLVVRRRESGLVLREAEACSGEAFQVLVDALRKRADAQSTGASS